MKLADMLDTDLLQKHIENRLVGVQKHSTLPLVIYNYTQKAQFEHVWGDGVIDYCRGLIVDSHGFVIARPFKKFHNLDTLSIPETIQGNLPDVLPHVTEKMDGSLGILYTYEHNWGIATRGSFTSPQAIWATNWYYEQLNKGNLRLHWPGDVTPLFEIIYNENRIVCKYDFEGLVLLGIVDKETGAEWHPKDVQRYGLGNGFEDDLIVKHYGNTNLYTLLSENETNREGYVLTYDIGDQPPIKVKVKFDEYVKLHRVITGVSPKAIWELLSSGKDRSFIEQTPEHFKDWAEKWIDKLFDDFNLIFTAATDIYLTRPYRWCPDYDDDKVYRAHCAEYFKKRAGAAGMPNGVLGIAFAMLDGRQGKELDDMIWRLVKPRGDDKSFRTDGE
jgi:RNA ligase